MTTPTLRRSYVSWKTALVVFCIVTISTILPRQKPLLSEIAQIVIFPGWVADIILSGNVHCGFANPLLDYSVGIAAAWAFWMALTVLITWATRMLSPKSD
jgi:hypothetical protein